MASARRTGLDWFLQSIYFLFIFTKLVSLSHIYSFLCFTNILCKLLLLDLIYCGATDSHVPVMCYFYLSLSPYKYIRSQDELFVML